MAAKGERRRWGRYVRGLAAPVLLWSLFVGLLITTLWSRLRGNEAYDEAALREWIEESQSFHKTLPEMVRHYLARSDPVLADEIHDHLQALCDPTKIYQGQLLLFPSIYRLEVEFRTQPVLPPIIWESGIPRPEHTNQVLHLEYPLLGPQDNRAVLHIEYQMHAYNKRQRDEQTANLRLRWVSGLAIAATVLAFLWITLVHRQEQERERQRALAQYQVNQAERLLLEEELRRQEAERRREEAERHALELKSQLYASIGIMAGSYAHNIKNLLVRPNDLLRRCLEVDGLSAEQDYMLREVRQTLGTVTERLQQILHTVRRDPGRSELVRLELNHLVQDIFRAWEDLAREKWKMTLSLELSPEPLWIEGDLSHLQQAIENLLFNARDATFEMRSHLREQARQHIKTREEGLHKPEEKEVSEMPAGLVRLAPNAEDSRKVLIAAAAWRGTTVLRTRREGDRAILEVRDNGIGMTEEVRRHCTETHFTTKRDNALYEGHSTGMGLGLSFVVVIVEHHHAQLEIESEPRKGALFRISLPLWTGPRDGGGG